MTKETLQRRQLLAREAHRMFVGYGCCERCNMPWSVTDGHTTFTKAPDYLGLFPLCVECWADLTHEERLPFYRQLWESWPINLDGSHGNMKWDDIEKAMLNETNLP